MPQRRAGMFSEAGRGSGTQWVEGSVILLNLGIATDAAVKSLFWVASSKIRKLSWICQGPGPFNLPVLPHRNVSSYPNRRTKQ